MKTNTYRRRWLIPSLLLWLAGGSLAQAFYDPSTGRWLNRDPLGIQIPQVNLVWGKQFFAETAQGANLFWPFRNDPISRHDPDGRIVPALVCVIIAGVLSCGCKKAPPSPPPPEYPDCWDRMPGFDKWTRVERERQCRLCCGITYGGPTPEGGDDDALQKCLDYCTYKASGM